MADPPPKRPTSRSRQPRDRGPERLLALAGVAGLLLVMVISIALIARAAGGGDEEEAITRTAAAPEATATPEPTPTPKPKPTPVPLTAAQRAERADAAAIVASRGFEVVRLRDYDPRDTLRVLIGRTSTGGRMAFFFVQGDYIGNDSTSVSARLRVRRTSDLAATLSYGVVEPGQAAAGARPKAGRTDVRFRWDGAQLTAQPAVPDASLRAPGVFG